MNIQTVKLQQSGYLVNGSLSVPADPANRHYWLVQEWIDDGNSPEPEFSEAELLKNAKSSAELQIQQKASAIRQQIAGVADQYKTAGWTDRARRAERITAGVPLPKDIEIVQAEADRRGRGETVDMLVAIHLVKAAKYAEALSVIDGLESSAVAAVNSKNSPEEIANLLVELEQVAETELALLLNS